MECRIKKDRDHKADTTTPSGERKLNDEYLEERESSSDP